MNDIVVLNPDNKTTTIAVSYNPNPVYSKFDENGVINVHPETVSKLFEHLTT